MKKRIIFVDDTPLVLHELQRLLRPIQEEWDMVFAESGEKALEVLRTEPCDVIVSDMTMPGMNGVQLLTRVRDESSNTIRIVLSGPAEKELALQCVGVAHQFLSKPCDAEHLRSTIARVTDLGFAVQSEKLMKLVGRMERLPSPPAIYLQLVELLEDQNSSTQKVGALIARDIALTANLLKIVNSSFFRLAQQVNQPSEAVAYLGLNTLKAVVLTAGLFGEAKVDPASGFCMEAASEHGQKVAAIAQIVAEMQRASRTITDECYIAGLLHDIGKLILVGNLPEQFRRIAAVDGRDILADEVEVFGATHAEIGGYLLGLWGLPSAVVEATRLHHTPSESPVRSFTALTAVHVADHLVRQVSGGCSSSSLDEAWLASLGLLDRIPAWQAAAEKLLSSSSLAARNL